MLHWAFAVSDIFEFYSPCCTFTGTNDKVIVDAVRLSRKHGQCPLSNRKRVLTYLHSLANLGYLVTTEEKWK